jgi:hypothetical protein
MTKANLEARVENVNRRLEEARAVGRVQVQGRNGYTGLDLYRRDDDCTLNLPDSVPGRGAGWIQQSTLTVGTKREVGDFLHAMMVGMDLARSSS